MENGRAVKEKTATGGTHIKSGTYQKQRSVFVNINDLDFFNLIYALTADHHRVHALDAEKGQEYYCPVCGNQVIPRQGEVNSWHFAHVTSCMDDWKYDMSEWHRGWQSRFPENVREIVVEHRGECHRADILMGGYDIEFQHGLQNILLSKWKRFDAFLRDNQPYAPKCSRIKGNPRNWHICPKTHDLHNNQCRECQNNLFFSIAC